ncbi:MAG: MarR family transcriptional regulator [Asticcacaulis sp.]|uniref:MarR family winged helix-turn-helix transcriptional regulator n=1 Tax=Asticcacaulis sp. TaxID=1872648 RepID=UPI0039E47EE1
MFSPDFFSRPGHLVNRLARLMNRLGEERLKPLGFSTGQLPVLGVLSDGKALPQKDLAQWAKIEQPSMAQMLARMERDGLIHRIPDPEDKRSSLISLTEDAIARLPAMHEVLTQGNADALTGLSDEEVATLSLLLKKVIANLEALDKTQEAQPSAPRHLADETET